MAAQGHVIFRWLSDSDATGRKTGAKRATTSEVRRQATDFRVDGDSHHWSARGPGVSCAERSSAAACDGGRRLQERAGVEGPHREPVHGADGIYISVSL